MVNTYPTFIFILVVITAVISSAYLNRTVEASYASMRSFRDSFSSIASVVMTSTSISFNTQQLPPIQQQPGPQQQLPPIQQQPGPQQQLPPIQQQSPQQDDSRAHFIEYKNPTHSISIRYPSTWELIESSEPASEGGVTDLAKFISPSESLLDEYREQVWLSVQ